MRLLEFPAGQTLFLDANCLIYHFTGTYASCALLLERARRRELTAVTSTAVIAEVHHRLMVLEAARRLGRPLRGAVSYLKRHPDLIRSLRDCGEAIRLLGVYRLKIVPVSRRLILSAHRLSHELGLLTTDALIVATMRAQGLRHLASADRDFRRVPNLTLWTP